jgi:hypothetical protein
VPLATPWGRGSGTLGRCGRPGRGGGRCTRTGAAARPCGTGTGTPGQLLQGVAARRRSGHGSDLHPPAGPVSTSRTRSRARRRIPVSPSGHRSARSRRDPSLVLAY